MKKVRVLPIRVRASFIAYLFSMGILASWQSCLCACVSLFVHELGHYFALKAMGESIDRIELTPFGGIMYASREKNRAKGLRGTVIALAGPLANYAFILLITSENLRGSLSDGILKNLIASSWVMLVLNLLPALPLDGGQAVFCLGYYYCRISALISALTSLGMFAGSVLMIVAVYGFVKLSVLNCSLVLIGLYLLRYAHVHQKLLKAENLYVIIREKMYETNQTQPVRMFSVADGVPLHALLTCMDDKSTSVFLCKKSGKLSLISEQQVCSAMMHNPNLSFEQLDHTS